jgi:hypothetical protein
MMKVYRLDCVQGVFGVKPDGNFERLLRVSSKILLNVSERDRYYRAWLGLAYVLAMKEYFNQLEGAEPKDLVFEIKRQWLSDLLFCQIRWLSLIWRGFWSMPSVTILVTLPQRLVLTKGKLMKYQRLTLQA